MICEEPKPEHSSLFARAKGLLFAPEAGKNLVDILERTSQKKRSKNESNRS
jgi:hypothetical protein